jgi:hypothetical protein
MERAVQTGRDTPKACHLSAAIGNDEECPRGWCAFWEHGGSAGAPGCAIGRMGIDLTNVRLAYHLLDLRHALEAVRGAEDAQAAWHAFGQVRPPGL